MLFSALILVSVDCEHDCLQQRIDLGHGDEPTQMRNVPRFGLEEKEQVAVLLCLFVVGEEAFLQFEAVCEVVCDFVLLGCSQYQVCV
jgi:hypothetical protein